MTGHTLNVRFRLTEELESHPLWTVFKGEDLASKEPVRVRLLSAPFHAEAEFVAALRQHSELLMQTAPEGSERVVGFFEEPDSRFLVTTPAEAITLDERLRKLGTLSTQLALSIAAEACTSLEHLHGNGLCHGDVSPFNILLQPQGPVLLALPGFWETYSASNTAGIAIVSRMSPYMAPEVATGALPSPASDVYSLGVVLYQMLSGKVPYQGATAANVAEKHSISAYPTLKFVLPDLPTPVDEIVRKCLAKSPADRYASVQTLAAELRHVLDALRFGRPLEWPPKTREPEPAPIVPDLNAVQGLPKDRKARARRASRTTDGVPAWLTALLFLSTGLVVLAVGSWVAFNAGAPRTVDLPNIVGLPSTQAKERLDELGLRMVVGRRAPSERYSEGVVIDQQPAPGPGKAREKSFVTVVLSSGGKSVVVPNLAGKSLDDARTLLGEVGLSLDDNIIRVKNKDVPAGRVVSQKPTAKETVPRNATVAVQVSSGDEEPGREGSGFHTYSLTIKMPSGTIPRMVRVEMTDSQETKTIHEAEHLPGESFEVAADGAGGEATFRIFFDDELVRQVTQKAE